MGYGIRVAVFWLVLFSLPGCYGPLCHAPDGRHHSDVLDAAFHRRPYDPNAHAHFDPAMALARELTQIEDDLRRDGTITVKKPDVWGDGNLMYFLQEYDQQLAARTLNFSETVQAYVARSDELEFQSTTGLSAALGASSSTTSTQATPAPINLDKPTLVTAPAPTKGIGVEPTELARQHSTYIDVCQALRRRHMGDDNSRAAGYGLYKFRVPISVLPGRETSEGFSAVATLRAQLIVDAANLRYTFPRLAIADLVDNLAPVLHEQWDPSNTAAQVLGTAEAIAIRALPMKAMRSYMARAAQRPDSDTKATLPEVPLDHALATDSSVPPEFLAEAIEAARAPGSAKDFLESKLPDDQLMEDIQRVVEIAREIHCDGISEAAKPGIVRELRSIRDRYFSETCDLRDDLPEGTALTLKSKPQFCGVVTDAIELLELGPISRNSSPEGSSAINPNASTILQADALKETRDRIKEIVQIEFLEKKPSPQELRIALFRYFSQVNNVLLENRAYSMMSDLIHQTTADITTGNLKTLEDRRLTWMNNGQISQNETLRSSGWLLAMHVGLLDHNLKRLLKRTAHAGKLSDTEVALLQDPSCIHFYDFDNDSFGQAVILWQALIREEFPIHVFTLDAQVEEQNVYDAFSRRRELQLALAYNVAKGTFNAQQKIAMSRQLALEESSIGLNRTVIGFAHGNDTFGWYFHPRVQSPPTESTNIGALARTLWSTGPTEHYDLKHRKLEPGIRECEVLVAMPSFVNQLSFDVTTNWEQLTLPGVTKRSYEEMLAQGSHIHQLKMSLGHLWDDGCYRPGDVQRLVSRIDQLEHMLGLQTHVVKLPFAMEQSGNDMFDEGKRNLVPELTGFYGLEFIKADDDKVTEVHFFLTGKNFHPTLTHVITGGYESHAIGTSSSSPNVEVISRELLRVKIGKLAGALTDLNRGFQVRVGTPDGLSDPLRIASPKPAPAAATPKGFSFDNLKALSATYALCKNVSTFKIKDLPTRVTITNDQEAPLPVMNGMLVLVLTAKDASGNAMSLGNAAQATTGEIEIKFLKDKQWLVDRTQLTSQIENTVNSNKPADGSTAFEITLTGYVRFDNFPVTKLLESVKVTVRPCTCDCPPAATTPSPATNQQPSLSDPAPNLSPSAGELPKPVTNRQSEFEQIESAFNGPVRNQLR